MLERLCSENNRWYAIALSICGNEQLSRDLVQEMYIRIDKYVKDESKLIDKETGEINPFYIYVTIKNIYFKWINDRKRIEFVDIIDSDFNDDDIQQYNDSYLAESILDEKDSDEMERAYQKMVDEIMDEAKQWHWYDEKLFKLYFLTDMSFERCSSRNENIIDEYLQFE